MTYSLAYRRFVACEPSFKLVSRRQQRIFARYGIIWV